MQKAKEVNALSPGPSPKFGGGVGAQLAVGLHFHGTDFDLGPALDRGYQSYTILMLDRELVRPAWLRHPRALFHLRQWAYVTDDPIGRAREAASVCEEIHQVCSSGGTGTSIDLWASSANEPDQESFGGHMTQERFERWTAYATAWAQEMRLRSPRTRLLYSAISPGHDEDGPDANLKPQTSNLGPAGLIGYRVMERAMRLYDGFAAHLYVERRPGESPYWHDLRLFREPGFKDRTEGVDAGDPGGLYHLTRAWRRPDGSQYPILITETNVTNVLEFGAPERIRAWLQAVAAHDGDRRILGIHWFVWTSPDDRFKSMQLAQRPAAIEAWRDVERPGPESQVPSPPPETRDQRLETRDRGPTAIVGNLRVEDRRASLPRHVEQGYAYREPREIDLIVVHHSATPADTAPEALARYHVEHNGWPGIGYHFLVYRDGTILYVGDLATVRYHATEANRRAVGLCLVGDFSQDGPPPGQLVAARRLVAEVQYQLGWFVPVAGHRDVGQTACPGATWPRWQGQVEVKPD